MKKQKILYVEDNIELAELVRDFLLDAEYDASILHSGADVLDFVSQEIPDLILLDLMLPEVDGISLCQEIRKYSEVPIIMVTAKVDEIDRLIGFDSGADDYVCKPIKPLELVARVKAVLRRVNSGTSFGKKISLNHEQLTAQWGSTDLELTRIEFHLLATLARQVGWIYSRRQLQNSIEGLGQTSNDRSIDSHIKNLRKKIRRTSKIENPIRSVYGVGYKLEL